jgi:hypothetical protein
VNFSSVVFALGVAMACVGALLVYLSLKEDTEEIRRRLSRLPLGWRLREAPNIGQRLILVGVTVMMVAILFIAMASWQSRLIGG